jgi:alkylhydroperoxidase/carboxymuconolactone decarboxylase family protein YurZ
MKRPRRSARRTCATGLVEYTTEYPFRDLWLRPDLAPRDRSLVTVAALIAAGRVAKITYHLNRAMDNELTQEQARSQHTPGLLRGLAPCDVGAELRLP